MSRCAQFSAVLILLTSPLISSLARGSSFICQEPGGKRLVYINDKEVSLEKDRNKTLIYIDGNDLLKDIHAEPFLVVDDRDICPSHSSYVKIANFDGEDLRHGGSSSGKILINYHHPDLCPTSSDNRIYSIEGDPISKQQLVAGLYLLKPEMFKLSDEELAAQKKAIKEAGEEQDRKDAADQIAGAWTMLNSSGIQEKLGGGTITVGAKKGDAYPVTFDFTKAGGPTWTGAGVYKVLGGDKLFWAAYGSPKTVGLCVYEINGGTLKGTWYPWYIDGTDKTIGTETLTGPETLDGTYKITSAKAPATGAPYEGTVTIKPTKIVGTNDDAKPYLVTWTFGAAKINGIGIRTKNFLFVSSGSGTDACIAKFKIDNGSMTSDWFKLGSSEMGNSAAMGP